LLRRRGVACSRSNSLMGGDESIRGTRMSQCGLLLGCVCVPIPHKAFPGNRCQDKCMSASNPQIRLGKPVLLDPVQIEISPLPAVAQETSEAHTTASVSTFRTG
jgi:hypothetical protein